jgi:hypothetical protein
MFDALFDLPLWITGPGIVVVMISFGLGGMFLVRRRVLPHLRVHVQDSEFAGAMVQCVMVFYGLAVALIAVSVWQTYSDVSKLVSQEATAIASLCVSNVTSTWLRSLSLRLVENFASTRVGA